MVIKGFRRVITVTKGLLFRPFLTILLKHDYLAGMRRLQRTGPLFLTIISTIAISACATIGGGSNLAEAGDEQRLPEAPVISLDQPLELHEILYVSELGRTLHTVSAEGGDHELLLDWQGYDGFARGIITSHAWSSDGDAIAASVHLRTDEGRRLEVLYIGKEGSKEMRPVFSSPEVSPFYLYWNPESPEISFIGGDGSGALYLYVADTETGETTLAHRGTSSMYWSWTADGRSLITNSGGNLREGLGTLRIHERREEGFEPTVLTREERSAGRFQVPDVAGNDRIAVAVRNEYGSNTLAVFDQEGTLLRRVADFQGVGSLSWSPSGRYLAYVEGNRRYGGGIIGTLKVVDTDRVDRVVSGPRLAVPAGMATEVQHTKVQRESQSPPSLVLSYMWSPDSRSILYYEPRYIQQGGELEILMEASLLDAETGNLETLGSFRPAPEFLSRVLPFYDQYARSSTFWSPDGRRIVFNGLNDADNQAIFIIDLDDREAGAMEIAEGVVPLWRP